MEVIKFLVVAQPQDDNQMCDNLQDALEAQGECTEGDHSIIVVLRFLDWPETGRRLPPQAKIVTMGVDELLQIDID